jgi:hypothetical protein
LQPLEARFLAMAAPMPGGLGQERCVNWDEVGGSDLVRHRLRWPVCLGEVGTWYGKFL